MAPEVPKTHKAAIFKKKGEPLTVEEVQTPSPKEGEVLVKVLAVGVCHSDMIVQSEMMGPLPRIPGHEVIADVVAVGPGEKKWKVGDRVGAPWHGGHDESCRQCKLGRFQCCEKEEVNGVSRDGGYQEYVAIRSNATVRVPKDLDPAQYAPFLCAGVTVFNSIRNMGIPKGEIVAVQGLGGLGHLAIQFASKMGYKVIALSSSGAKEKFARDLGADEYIDGSKTNHTEALQKMGGAGLIVSTAPNPNIMGELLTGVAPMGTLLLLSPSGEVKLDTIPLVVGGRTVRGWPSGHAKDSEDALEFADKNGIKCLCETFPFEKVNEAFEHMAKGKARFRAVITFP